MVVFWALSTTGSVNPYWSGAPGFQSAMNRSTLNSEKKMISCGIIGRQPASGLTPFSL